MPTRNQHFNNYRQQVQNLLGQLHGNNLLSGPNLFEIKEKNIVKTNESEVLSPGPGVGCETIKYSYTRNYEMEITFEYVVFLSFNRQTNELKTRLSRVTSGWMTVTNEIVAYTIIECPGIFDLKIPENYAMFQDEEILTISIKELESMERQNPCLINTNGVESNVTIRNIEILSNEL